MAGVATPQDAAELASFAQQLRRDVLDWLKKTNPKLLPKERK